MVKAILIKLKFKTNKILFNTTNKHRLNHKTDIITHHISTFRVFEIKIITLISYQVFKPINC